MAIGTPSFTSVASIPKLKGKVNYEEWRNAVQGFCEMNGLWRYMLGKIKKPKSPSPPNGEELDEKTQESYDAKLLQWLTVTDSLRGVIRSTCTLDPMSHVNNLDLCSDMWAKFELLYRDTGFIERDAILIRLSSKTSSNFDDVAQFVDSLKRNSTRLKEIGTTDVPSWMFTTWLLHGLSSKYDSFRMMLNNNRKASEQSQKTKVEPDFDSILEQILNLDTQKKTSEARSMKSALKPKEKKKSSTEPSDLCPYCARPGHFEEKCYYKHSERTSEDFRQRFQNRIKELRFKANATKTQNGDKNDAENDKSTTLGNRGYVAQQKDVVLATGSHDPNWYFDNAASYHMTFDLANFDNADSLTQCRHPQDDITLADGSVILPDGIDTITLLFRTKNSTEKIFLSGVRYCSKLDTKLISLGMLDRKGLSYSSSGGILEVRDRALPIMSGHLTAHNLYKVDLEDATTNFVTISQRAMTANTSKSAADLLVWHRRFAHLNEASIKELVTITSGMVISPSTNKLPFCSVCVEAKITRQPHRQP